jgi:ABC-2 type transport system ATP-binding protein
MQEFIIDVKGISKRFADLVAVDHLDMQVRRGEIFGFLGPNGSGKTTTIRMLCGLLTPDSGSGHCLGHDIIKETALIREHVGYMTQSFSLYKELTVEENLDFSARVYGVKKRQYQIQKIMQMSGLTERKHQLAGELSGGWRQRLALAAALLHEPELLLLDEPTAGVDPKARREFWDHIHQLSLAGVTTLVSTHYMDEAERCQRIAYIAYGKLLADGTIDDVIQQAGLTTWRVKGPQLGELSNQLRKLPGVTQVVAFGNSLHVSGHDATLLAKSIQPYQTTTHHWELAQSTLEDVFISLVSETET